MKHVLFNITGIFSSLVGAMAILFWMRSYREPESIRYITSRGAFVTLSKPHESYEEFLVSSNPGELTLARGVFLNCDHPPDFGFSNVNIDSLAMFDPYDSGVTWGNNGATASGRFGQSLRFRAVTFPYALPIILCLISPAVWVFQYYRRRCRTKRRENGKCVNCDYDLRASSIRCPECGVAIPDIDAGHILTTRAKARC